MPLFQVIPEDKPVEVLIFEKQLMILNRDERIIWKADDELAKVGGGEIMIWAQRQRGDVYRLLFVRPDWHMTIDGEQFPAEFHQDVALNGRLVELEYQNYRFIFDSVTSNSPITGNP